MVIGIIAILTSIAYVSLTETRGKSRDQKRVADISSIQLALTMYYNRNSVYPLTLDALKPVYLPSIPTNPKGGAEYTYRYVPLVKASATNQAKCTSFHLGALLELPSSQIDANYTHFNSVASGSSNYVGCQGSSAVGFDGADSNFNSRMYDVKQ